MEYMQLLGGQWWCYCLSHTAAQTPQPRTPHSKWPPRRGRPYRYSEKEPVVLSQFLASPPPTEILIIEINNNGNLITNVGQQKKQTVHRQNNSGRLADQRGIVSDVVAQSTV